jgi:hypothetical protein
VDIAHSKTQPFKDKQVLPIRNELDLELID